MTGRENAGTRMVAALTAAGFTVVGQRAGQYVRLCWAGTTDRRWTLVVPVNDSFADYQDSLDEVTDELRGGGGAVVVRLPDWPWTCTEWR